MFNQKYENFMLNRQDGFGVNLYLNKKNKILGGVCAGFADHFEIDRTLARVLFIAALFFSGFNAVWVYLLAWVILVPKKKGFSKDAYEYNEDEHRYKKKKIFRSHRHASDRIRLAAERVKSVSEKVEKMERYVTSKKYRLDKEFEDLERQ